MSITTAQVETLLMGRLGKGPAGWKTLMGVLVEVAVPLGAAELVLRDWIRDAILRKLIEPCPFATDCYRLHTKVNVARRPTQAEPGVEDVDEPDPVPADKLPTTAAEWRAQALAKQRKV